MNDKRRPGTMRKKEDRNGKHVILWHDPDALRWRVILTEVREMKDKIDKLCMLVEALKTAGDKP